MAQQLLTIQPDWTAEESIAKILDRLQYPKIETSLARQLEAKLLELRANPSVEEVETIVKRYEHIDKEFFGTVYRTGFLHCYATQERVHAAFKLYLVSNDSFYYLGIPVVERSLRFKDLA